MTETACVISALDKDDISIGHVGAPSPSCGWLHFSFHVVLIFSYLTSLSYFYIIRTCWLLLASYRRLSSCTLLSYIVHVDIFSYIKKNEFEEVISWQRSLVFAISKW